MIFQGKQEDSCSSIGIMPSLGLTISLKSSFGPAMVQMAHILSYQDNEETNKTKIGCWDIE